MQAQSVGKFCNTRSNESVGEVSLDDPIEGYIVNIAREKDEEPVRIPQSISAKLKPHQVSFPFQMHLFKKKSLIGGCHWLCQFIFLTSLSEVALHVLSYLAVFCSSYEL